MSMSHKVHYMRSHTITTTLTSWNFELVDCGVERPNKTAFFWTKQPEHVTCKKCQQSFLIIKRNSST